MPHVRSIVLATTFCATSGFTGVSGPPCRQAPLEMQTAAKPKPLTCIHTNDCMASLVKATPIELGASDYRVGLSRPHLTVGFTGANTIKLWRPVHKRQAEKTRKNVEAAESTLGLDRSGASGGPYARTHTRPRGALETRVLAFVDGGSMRRALGFEARSRRLQDDSTISEEDLCWYPTWHDPFFSARPSDAFRSETLRALQAL